MKKTWIGLLIAVLVGAGAWWLFGRKDSKPVGPSAQTLATAERQTLEVAAEASGLVEPVRVVEVKSKASGEVLSVKAETGDKVEQGALLAEIDPRDVQSSLEQAQADLQSARVKAQVTEAQRKRMETLRASATVTQQEYEAAVDAAAAARAAVVRNETSLRLAQERRGDVTIRAPISGTILSRSVEPGLIIASATNNISGGTALFQMADLTEMQVRAKITESDIGRIAVGQEARVTVEAYPGRTFVGRVAKVEPQAVVESNVTLFPVLVRIDNREGLLRPGMNGEVTIEIARRDNVVAVPSGAVVAPKDMMAAARTLGVDPETVRGAMRPPESAGGAGDGGSEDPACVALREEARTAGREALSEAQRAKLRECSPRAARGGGEGAARRSVVFIQKGPQIEARAVTVGLSDWEKTEIVQGVSEGEQVVLVNVALMQSNQQQSTERMRQRMGSGIVPGAGGGGRGGGRGAR